MKGTEVNMKKKFILVICMILLLSLSVLPSVSALEFMKPLRWSIKNGRLFETQVNFDLLNSSSFYQDNVTIATGNWQGSPTLVDCIMTNFSISNVDIATALQNSWDSWGLPSNALALTWLTGTNG